MMTHDGPRFFLPEKADGRGGYPVNSIYTGPGTILYGSLYVIASAGLMPAVAASFE
jgi:hypothetical protein